MNKTARILLVIFSWLALLASMLVIARFSLQNSSDSSETSESVLNLIPFYNMLSEEALGILHAIIRKIAHFTIYALLGFTAFNAYYNTIDIKRVWIFLLSVGFSSNYAFIDEFIFQSLSPGRAPMLIDVGIDTLGAIFGSILMLLITFLIKIIRKMETSN